MLGQEAATFNFNVFLYDIPGIFHSRHKLCHKRVGNNITIIFQSIPVKGSIQLEAEKSK